MFGAIFSFHFVTLVSRVMYVGMTQTTLSMFILMKKKTTMYRDFKSLIYVR